MKNLKWIALAALGTGMLFQLGGCGTWGTLAAALIGWSLYNSLTATA